MKILILILIFIILIGCSTIPQEYKTKPNGSEIVYIKTGAIWGIGMSIITVYTFYYLDRKAEWY